jgi:RND family efflux transporter MFP subunit
MKKPSIVLSAVALVLVAAMALLFRGGSGGEVANVSPDVSAVRPAMTVTVASPENEALPIRIAANGDIAAWQEAIISSDMADLRLVEVRVNVGDRVRAGEVLAVFDDEPVKVAVAQARAAVVEAGAVVAEAEENARRARALENSGALSRQTIAQYLTAEQSARARLAAAEAALAAQRLRLKRTRVRVPDDGVISARNATVGAVAGLGGELFRMVRQGRLEWRAALSAPELRHISPGVEVALTLAGGHRVSGKVRVLAPTVDAHTREGRVYVDLPSDGITRPGMFARGEFVLGSSPAMTVPQQSVVMREAFSYVFTLDDSTSSGGGVRVRQRKVTTGRRMADRVEITGGLPADARIVVAGAEFLNDGDLVRVVAETRFSGVASGESAP